MAPSRAQVPAQELAGGVTGQRRHELPLGRHLEACQRGARESPQFLAGRRVSRGGWDHERFDHLTQQAVGYPDYRCVGYLRMLEQAVLDLHRIDILPAPDDHVAASADQVQVAVAVDPAQVTSAEPAVRATCEQGVRPGAHPPPPRTLRAPNAYLHPPGHP